MKTLVADINSLSFEKSEISLKINTKLDPNELILRIKEKEEMPNAYLVFLSDLGSLDKKESKITLKVLRLYIYSRSKFRGDPKAIKIWLQSGSLQGDKPGSRFNISVLYNKLRSYSKAKNTIQQLSIELDESFKSFNNKSNKHSNAKANAYQKKEFRITDLEDDLKILLDEILVILDKIETLISSRNDQW